MKQKRKAAADIWQAQNVASEEAVMEELADYMDNFSDEPQPQAKAMMPAAPMMARESQQVRYQVESQQKGAFQKMIEGLKTSEELQLEKDPIRIRETGFWIFKRVIVPPNVYVVHTRMGHEKPITIGLGVSFRYNPLTDSYLIVPAAMQTIGVVANCISREKQGINVLAYLQWQIDDFAVAYRKLDFSDTNDPLGIVNAQLREQAEAAIKDKIATMSIEEVLTDKAPVIEELTTRLKEVAEGRKQDKETNQGLGIKIVTVQIREALVSSQRLWQDLQAPFRHDQEKVARISYLAMQQDIRQKELTTHQSTETQETETKVAIERIRQEKETEALSFKLEQAKIRQAKEHEDKQRQIKLQEDFTSSQRESEARLQEKLADMEQKRKLAMLQSQHDQAIEAARLEMEEAKQQKSLEIAQSLHDIAEDTALSEAYTAAEKARLVLEADLKKQEIEHRLMVQRQEEEIEYHILETRLAREREERMAALTLEREAHAVMLDRQEREVAISQMAQAARNTVNSQDLARQFIEQLPEIAAAMPEIKDLRVLQTGDDSATFNTLASFLTKAVALAQSLGIAMPAPTMPAPEDM